MKEDDVGLYGQFLELAHTLVEVLKELEIGFGEIVLRFKRISPWLCVVSVAVRLRKNTHANLVEGRIRKRLDGFILNALLDAGPLIGSRTDEIEWRSVRVFEVMRVDDSDRAMIVSRRFCAHN